MSAPTTDAPTTLRGIIMRAALDGTLPTDAELAAVIDQARGGTGNMAGQLHGVRKRLSVALSKLAQRAGTQAAADDAEDLIDEFATYSSVPGDTRDGQDPAALAALVPHAPGGSTDRRADRVEQRLQFDVVRPLRDLLRAAVDNGAPSPRELDRLVTSLDGDELAAWRERVTTACEEIRSMAAGGQQKLAREMADDFADELGDAMAEPEVDEDEEMDPRKLAAQVSRR